MKLIVLKIMNKILWIFLNIISCINYPIRKLFIKINKKIIKIEPTYFDIKNDTEYEINLSVGEDIFPDMKRRGTNE